MHCFFLKSSFIAPSAEFFISTRWVNERVHIWFGKMLGICHQFGVPFQFKRSYFLYDTHQTNCLMIYIYIYKIERNRFHIVAFHATFSFSLEPTLNVKIKSELTFLYLRLFYCYLCECPFIEMPVVIWSPKQYNVVQQHTLTQQTRKLWIIYMNRMCTLHIWI